MKTVLHQLKTDGRVLDGMSYVIQCGDGSTVVIDGAMYEDGEGLYSFLRELAGDKDPVVDAWFITHAHPDHTYCAKAVAEKFSERITVKKMIYRFPDEAFLRAKEPDCLVQVPAFENAIKAFGAEHVIPNAGDRYCFGDTEFEVLFTCADLPSLEEDMRQCLNDSSTVFRMYAGGQSVLFLGDVQESGDLVLMKRYGNKLKSDVCQVAHHGYNASIPSFYDMVDPDILLWPASEKMFKILSESVIASRYLVSQMDIKDIYLHGHGSVSLELPITERDEPFLPRLDKLPQIEKKVELSIPHAELAPDINDPLGESWSGVEYKKIDGRVLQAGKPFDSFYKAFWKDDKLYVNIRTDKKFVPNPHKVSTTQSDAVGLYFTDKVITDPNLFWGDFMGEVGYYVNIRVYGEEKEHGGKKIKNLGAGDNCSSSYLIEDDRFYLTACIQMGSVHKKGDLVGFNIDVSGLEENSKKRIYSVSLVSDSHGGNHGFSPFAIIHTQLV